jgi:indolepyruvate ferredoxin oxidoreductase beta subunit
MSEFNVVLVGVGGQGTLLAAEALGVAAVKDGLNVRVSEIHGMSQRGGSVVTMVRIGEDVVAPTVLEGQADVLVGFEPLETLRNLRYVSEKTLVIMSTEEIPPVELWAKNLKYPVFDEVVRKVRFFTENIVVVDVVGLACEAGGVLARNVVLLGAVAGAGKLPLKKESLVEAVRELVPVKTLKVNLAAFELGFACVEDKLAKT